MSQLINTLDNCNPIQLGENCHNEYEWSNNIQESILQFSFQLTRTDNKGILNLSNILDHLLLKLKNIVSFGSLVDRELCKGHLSILYKMIAHTRDIIDGKGEYTLSYMMVYIWNKHYPLLAKFALRCFFIHDDKGSHQYGSWKDFKYFCKYCKEQCNNENSSLVTYAIGLVNEQIKKDYANMISNSFDISLVSKWVPREKSSFGWIYESLATDYFNNILQTAKTEAQQIKALLKCKTEYRKIISSLNRLIDTTQIKQCGKEWKNIDFNKVTSITLNKQNKAFLNIKKNGEKRNFDDIDRN